jgi:hypothetical protein
VAESSEEGTANLFVKSCGFCAIMEADRLGCNKGAKLP